MKRFLSATAFFGGLVVLWQLLYDAHIWSPVLVPSPVSVVIYLKDATADGTLPESTLITIKRLLIGYVIGIVGGLPIGLLTARWGVVSDTVGTMSLGLQTLPVPVGFLSRCFGLDKLKRRCCSSWSWEHSGQSLSLQIQGFETFRRSIAGLP